MSAPTPPASPDADASHPLPADAEWLLVDGRGGYACGSVADLPTRRYHGLWVSRPRGTARRYMAVAGLDERLVEARSNASAGGASGSEDVQLGLMHAHWRGHDRPSAPAAEVSFARRPLPTWTFRTALGTIERTVALQSARDGGEPALCVRWRNLGDRPVRLAVRPLLGWCDADHLPPADESFDGTVAVRGASWGFRPSPLLSSLWLTADGIASFVAAAAWYRGFVYATDRDRGYDHVGDRWSPGVLELDLPPHAAATASFAWIEPCADPTAAFDAALGEAARTCRAAEASADHLGARLALGADDFLYRADGGRLGVLAGFPWFGEWGRDVFLALPGLTLARGRVDLAVEVLTGALPFLRRGLLPNIYGRDVADSHYGSCDAALWFSLAVQRLADTKGVGTKGVGAEVEALLRERLVPALVEIADAYVAGTDLGLAVQDDGLLMAGRPDLNATWMDARTSAGPVTPREGLPVEIQALWYALLAFLVERGEGRFADLYGRVRRAFVAQFWLQDEKFLADRVHAGVPDRSIRPNMLVAAALARSPLTQAQRRSVVGVAERALVTPVGLRTLAPQDPAYRGRYEGGPEQRDQAYHQGTVWPWPAGFYVEAALAAAPAKGRRKVAAELSTWLDVLLVELDRAGLDHVSEVFDGDAPHRPGGTFAQAWNTGELLRARGLVAAALGGGALGDGGRRTP